MVRVKQRALLLVTLLIIFIVISSLYEGMTHYSHEIKIDVKEQETLIHSITDEIEKYSYYTYHFQITNFINDNSEIIQAFGNGQRARLYELCAPLLKRYMEENPFFHAMDFNLPDGTVFLRVQKPDLFGDNILNSREIVSSVHEKQKQEFGFDIGKHGVIYWVAEPIFHDGKYLGLVEFGIEAKHLEQALSKALNSDVSSVLRGYGWNKADLKKEGFKTLGEYVLMTGGDTLFDKIPSDIDLSILHDQHILLEEREYILHNCTTMFDFQGEVIGRILLLQDISRKVDSKKSFIVHTLVVGFFLILFSFIIIYFSFGKLIGRLETYASKNLKAKEEIQEANDRLENRVEKRTMELQGVNERLIEEINERQQYQEKLEKYQQRLRAAASEMLAVEEQQRRQIAVELHDRIGQSLAFCKMSLDSIIASETIEYVREQADRVSDIVQQTLKDTRSLTFELSPPVLYELGLEAALEWLVEMMQERYDLLVSIECKGLTHYTGSPILTMSFRSIRELLMNVVRHGQTDKAWVKVWTSNDDQLHLSVSDKGTGFDTKELELESEWQEGFGLFSIQERTINLGGSVQVDSVEGGGTTISLTIPLSVPIDKKTV